MEKAREAFMCMTHEGIVSFSYCLSLEFQQGLQVGVASR